MATSFFQDSDSCSATLLPTSEGALVTLTGEIDVSNTAAFRSLMSAAVGTGRRHVTVDMAGLFFLDASGVSVLAGAARRLHASGGRLDVRAAPPQIFRIFDVAGLSGALRVHPAAAVPAALEQALAAVTGLGHQRELLDAALQLVVSMAQAVVLSADGVSITLPRDGHLGTVAASNDVVLDMDHDQYETGEGPCLDAAVRGERFHIVSLDQETRWPSFVPRARARGIRSILSTPLMAQDQAIGALNIYSRGAGAFTGHEAGWADQFAHEAAAVVCVAPVDPSFDVVAAEIADALLSREVVALAQGFVMHRDTVSAAAAHRSLVELSRHTDRPLREICTELVGAATTGSADGPDRR